MTASATCPIPNNINPLSPTGFKLSISKLPEVEFFTQEVTLPDVSLPPIDQSTPLSRISLPGDILSFGDFTINFLVDEDMSNYKAVFDWLNGLGFPESHDQYQNYVSEQNAGSNYNIAKGSNSTNYSDATLQILSNNNTPAQSIMFADLHPTSLSSLQFIANASDVNYLIGSASFRYTYFKFI
jgi:hypothetical protein